MRRVRDADLLALVHYEATECALTGATGTLEAHHIYPRAQGGDDVRANIIMLEREVHRRITVNDQVARRLLGEHLIEKRSDFLDYLSGKLGAEQAQAWLERRYLVDPVRIAC